MNTRLPLTWLLALLTALAPTGRCQDASPPTAAAPPPAAGAPAAAEPPQTDTAPAGSAAANSTPATPQRERLSEAEREARRTARRAQRQAERRAVQAQGQAPGQPATSASPIDTTSPAPPESAPAPLQDVNGNPAPSPTSVPAAPAARPGSSNTPATAAATEAADIRLNFRGVPLEMVLNHLSEAAGFIILLETQVRGTVDVWSNQPLTRTEAVDLLNTVLGKNGYAAIRNGRTLTIVSRDEAKKRNLPVKSGNDPESIPKSEEMVTQILPVRYINAPQLVRDLQSLMPPNATVASNEGGNAIVITDTQVNIRRLAEIVAALDTTVSGVATIRVFPLRYADSKALATTLRDLFTDTTSNNRGGNTATSGAAAFFAQRFGGAGGAGGAGGGGRGGTSSSAANPTAAKRVVAVADEHSNSLIVSASEDVMPTIEQLIRSVDTDVQDLTELRVFVLKFSDPQEMADLLTSLFPDTSRDSASTTGGGFRFGGGPFPGGGRSQAQAAESDRQKKQGKVIAVPDPRTSSVVVSAAKELMPQIEAMVAQLDANPARKQKVFVYSLENANVQEVEDILRGLFESQNSRNTSQNNNQQNNALQNRAQNANRQQGLGTTQGGLGAGGLGGGNTGGGLR